MFLSESESLFFVVLILLYILIVIICIRHNDKSKRRSIPEIVKRSHRKAGTPILF